MMLDKTTDIYFLVDDLLKKMKHREDSRRRFSDAEIFTLILVSCLYFSHNIEKARSYFLSIGFSPLCWRKGGGPPLVPGQITF